MNAAPVIGGRASARALVRAGSLALCAAGGALALQGAWVPAKAVVGQAVLERDFERSLAAARPRSPVAAPATAAKLFPVPQRATATKPAKLAIAGPAKPSVKLWHFVKPAPVARISIERLGIREVVMAGDGSHESLALGPTVVKRGDAGSPVTVLAAHRDTHFAFIRDLQAGDIVTMEQVSGEVERYRVTRFETVRWDRFAYPLDPARPLLALTTCYPFGGTEYGGPWRRVAWAEKVA